MAVTVALALAAPCIAPLIGATAYAQPPVLTAWLALNAQCRGGPPDDPKTVQACKKREEVSARLRRRGCVYQEDGDWWKCRH